MISSIKLDDLSCFHEMLTIYVVSQHSKPFSQKNINMGSHFTLASNLQRLFPMIKCDQGC